MPAMHRSKPSKSGYARIAQAEEEEEEEEGDLSYHDDPNETSPPHQQRTISGSSQYAPIQPAQRALMGAYNSINKSPYSTPSQKRRRRNRSNSAVDVKAINARLEKWADEIAQKFKLRKIKGKSQEEEKLEIHHSVFVPPDDIRPASAETLAARFMEQPGDHLTKMQFDDTVESVRVAIELGVHPKMISQGSSGSYFARNSEGKTLGVFKPKDEEPYATRNPKWTKWIHRNLFPFAFGRACLIPNLSYISEAAAYLLDQRLQTNIVPYTDIVYLSSIAFNHDFWDRRAYYRKRKSVPPKVGSFQVFLQGYQDATLFLKKHPWPDQQSSTLRAVSSGKGKRRKRWTETCRPTRGAPDDEDEEDTSEPGRAESRERKVFWTDALQLSFREQLEKLVILDYIMRNTDRGLDNWMIRIDPATETASIVAEAPKTDQRRDELQPAERQDAMRSGSTTPKPSNEPFMNVSLGAIDNSLSWPWKHPDAWRSFPFGWLFLPVSLIGQPFTQNTREHFLPLLTSKQWWSETQVALRRCFEQDSDFKERMFARQMAVMKGQAWNVVETLKTEGHGPLELTRRARVCVWDDLVDIPVVVPMRESSDEPKERATQSMDFGHLQPQPDEMDLSTAREVPPKTHGYGSFAPDGVIPSSQRFNLSRQGSTEDAARPLTSDNERFELSPQERDKDGGDNITIRVKSPEYLPSVASGGKSKHGLVWARPPHAPRSKTRTSYEGPRAIGPKPDTKKRNMSFSARRLSSGAGGDSDEDDGDLGFAAATASDVPGRRRKVIVERLETIKSRGPFFTWC